MDKHSILTLDSDCSDDLVINEEEFKRPNYSSSEEEEDCFYKPNAPPPSPQETTMFDMMKEDKPVERKYSEHAQTLDKLLRRTLNQQNNKICKKKRTSWSTLEKQHKLKAIMKVAAERTSKLKRTFVIDEETALVIHELREMGL